MIELICFLLFILIGFMLYKINYRNENDDEDLEENINKLSENLHSPSPQKYYIVSDMGLSYDPSNTKLGVDTAISMLKTNPSYNLLSK